MNTPSKTPTLTNGRTNQLLLNKKFRKSLISLVLTTAIFFGLRSQGMGQQSKIDSLLKVLENTKTDTVKVNVLCLTAHELSDTKPDKAIEYANRGLALSNKIGFRKGASTCLNALGLANYQLGKYDTALVQFKKHFEIVKELKDSMGIAGAYDNICVIYFHFGKTDTAFELRAKANNIYYALKKNKKLASGYVWIGNILKERGEYDKSLDYYLRAAKIYEDENDEQDLGYPLINICSVYRYLQQYEKAKKYGLNAKELFEKSNNPNGAGSALYRLALISDEEKDFDRAIKYLKEARKIFLETRNVNFQTLVDQQLGETYLNNKDYAKALNYFNLSLTVAQQMGDTGLISTIYGNIGSVYFNKGDYQRALIYMQKSEKLIIATDDKLSLLYLTQNFIEIFSRTNQPDSVSKYFENYRQLSDKLFNKQSTKAIAEMQTKYETEKKDKEILSLNIEATKRKNTIWFITSGFGILLVLSGSGFAVFRNQKKKVQAELQQQVAEHDIKALRAQMNPHFIFNCIHSIDRLLDDSKIGESKKCLSKFSALTRSVLENSEHREILLSEELRILSLYMDLENTRFSIPFVYTFIISPEINPEITLLPPLILQPFVENSIKHGFSKDNGGLLIVDIQKNEGSLICLIEDNGCGRNYKIKDDKLSGFKNESMGIRLSEDRLKLISELKQAKAYFEIEDLTDTNNSPTGTRVKITLPFEQAI